MTCCNHLPRHTMKWSRFLTDIPTYVDLFYMKLVQVFLSPIMLNKYYYHLYCAFITCNVFGNLEYHFHIYVWSEIVYFLRFCKNIWLCYSCCNSTSRKSHSFTKADFITNTLVGFMVGRFEKTWSVPPGFVICAARFHNHFTCVH